MDVKCKANSMEGWAWRLKEVDDVAAMFATGGREKGKEVKE